MRDNLNLNFNKLVKLTSVELHRLGGVRDFEFMLVLIKHLDTLLLELPTFWLLVDLKVVTLEVSKIFNLAFLDNANIYI